jgi:predicted DNA repair protein MutK
MFLVGGGILTHGIGPLHHGIEALGAAAAGVPVAGVLLGALAPFLLDAVAGVVAGGLVLAGVLLVRRLMGRKAAV